MEKPATKAPRSLDHRSHLQMSLTSWQQYLESSIADDGAFADRSDYPSEEQLVGRAVLSDSSKEVRVRITTCERVGKNIEILVRVLY